MAVNLVEAGNNTAPGPIPGTATMQYCRVLNVLNKMSYHIRRDGAWLCKKDITRSKTILKHLNERHVTFADAHKMGNLKYCCKDCLKRYYEIVSNMDNPIIIK